MKCLEQVHTVKESIANDTGAKVRVVENYVKVGRILETTTGARYTVKVNLSITTHGEWRLILEVLVPLHRTYNRLN